MFSTTFSRRGIAIALSIPSSFWSAGATSFTYRSFNLTGMSVLSSQFLVSRFSVFRFRFGLLVRRRPSPLGQSRPALLREPLGGSIAVPAPADPRPDVAVRIDQHDVRDMEGRLSLGDSARDVLRRVRPRVALDHVDALDDHSSGGRHDFQDFALAPAILARDHDHE